jgi:hypothetical protein
MPKLVLWHFEVSKINFRGSIETGILGLAGFLLPGSGSLGALFNARNSCPTEGLRRVCALTIFLFSSLFFTNVAFNHIASFFAWSIFAVTIAAVSARSEAAVALRMAKTSGILSSRPSCRSTWWLSRKFLRTRICWQDW